MPEFETLRQWADAQWAAFEAWLRTQVLVWSTLAEIVAVFVLLLPAWLGARPLERRLLALRNRWQSPGAQRFAAALATVAMPIL
jgi:hypothetical protein